MTTKTASHDLRHFHPSLHLGLLHEERVENGHIKRQHIDVQFVLRHKIVDELSQRHFTAIVLHSSHIKSIPEGPFDIVVLCVCVCIGVHVCISYSRNIWRGINFADLVIENL